MLEALSDLRHQLSALYERHRQFYPPPSPYFRDTPRRRPAASGVRTVVAASRYDARASCRSDRDAGSRLLGQDRPQIEQEPVLVDAAEDARVPQPQPAGQRIDSLAGSRETARRPSSAAFRPGATRRRRSPPPVRRSAASTVLPERGAPSASARARIVALRRRDHAPDRDRVIPPLRARNGAASPRCPARVVLSARTARASG